MFGLLEDGIIKLVRHTEEGGGEGGRSVPSKQTVMGAKGRGKDSLGTEQQTSENIVKTFLSLKWAIAQCLQRLSAV